MDVENTYNKEEVEQLTGKTFLELYPDYPSWTKQTFQEGSVVTIFIGGWKTRRLSSIYV